MGTGRTGAQARRSSPPATGAVGGDTPEQAREEDAVRHAGREHAAAIDAALLLETIQERPHEARVARLVRPDVPAAPRRPEEADSVVALGMDRDEAVAEGEPPHAGPPALSLGAAAKAVEVEDERQRAVAGGRGRVDQVAALLAADG